MALAITIVLLIILATVSINAVLGENGIIKKAQDSKEVYEQAKTNEEMGMDKLLQELNDATDILPIRPKVAEGMTKVKYNSESGNWEKVTDDEEKWYDYGQKEWANVVLGDATFNENILDESAPYVQLVWIPRYAYKITSQYHQNGTGAGNVEVVFIDTTNKSKDGTTTYSTTYPSATIGGGMSEFVVHPAFNYGGQSIAGFWMGKFESSHRGCTTDVETGQANYTGNEIMTVKANVTSWRNIKIGDIFSTCLDMNNAENPYGLNTSDSVVDPHLTKNDEWGACAYLSQSKYGKNAEVFINNNSNFITGIAGDEVNSSSSTQTTNSYKTEKGVQASTTGNTTGMYDMSGGNWERVAAYVDSGHDNLIQYGEDLVATETASRYRNVYETSTSIGVPQHTINYGISTPANGYYGDAVYETSSSSSDSYTYSWYSDYSLYPAGSVPFFIHGGGYSRATDGGLFAFSRNKGSSSVDLRFPCSRACTLIGTLGTLVNVPILAHMGHMLEYVNIFV